jgi:hypothetical protein
MNQQPTYGRVRLPMPHMSRESQLRLSVLADHRLATLQLAELCVLAAPEDTSCARFVANRRTKWLELPEQERERALGRYH